MNAQDPQPQQLTLFPDLPPVPVRPARRARRGRSLLTVAPQGTPPSLQAVRDVMWLVRTSRIVFTYTGDVLYMSWEGRRSPASAAHADTLRWLDRQGRLWWGWGTEYGFPRLTRPAERWRTRLAERWPSDDTNREHAALDQKMRALGYIRRDKLLTLLPTPNAGHARRAA
ncbi:hypothetical protein GCM10012275_61470 [Longimycelium tulufanense]|uniref:Uncharacterized protein n=1 Tax=Longimycelium tulufanense TaxID=907463 RepID=A0A8J3FXU1_9PSEU|nr:hypothetical protein [Longimycelium tulufanense]GGM82606.1 hypothetical protein GCM10012275_61470 [Longimycelium tulufanense]